VAGREECRLAAKLQIAANSGSDEDSPSSRPLESLRTGLDIHSEGDRITRGARHATGQVIAANS
jgi:hypothetical protein